MITIYILNFMKINLIHIKLHLLLSHKHTCIGAKQTPRTHKHTPLQWCNVFCYFGESSHETFNDSQTCLKIQMCEVPSLTLSVIRMNTTTVSSALITHQVQYDISLFTHNHPLIFIPGVIWNGSQETNSTHRHFDPNFQIQQQIKWVEWKHLTSLREN